MKAWPLCWTITSIPPLGFLSPSRVEGPRLQSRGASLWKKPATWLRSQPQVAWVSYPGLPSHPQRDIMELQMSGPGAMIAFGVRKGLDAAKTMIDAVRLCTRAVSLGGVETLIEHPASMTHAGMPSLDRAASGIRDDLVRLSVGCEAFEDIRDDLAQALGKAVPETVATMAGSR